MADVEGMADTLCDVLDVETYQVELRPDGTIWRAEVSNGEFEITIRKKR